MPAPRYAGRVSRTIPKVSLDALLVKRRLCADRDAARARIVAGDVRVDGIAVTSPAARVSVEQRIDVGPAPRSWVGRGAHKLIGALDALGVDPAGCVAVDLGASTGGFTEVLLDRGAARVYAVDVGRGLLHWKLRTDPRVVLMEGTNARTMDPLPEPIDLVVGDLSFISLDRILPSVHRLLRPGGVAVVLVKPQFEAARADVGADGKVRTEAARTATLVGARECAISLGFDVLGGVDSTVPGARAGNVEHFLHLRRPDPGHTAPPAGGMLHS